MQFVVLPWQDKLGTNLRKTIEKDDGVSHLQRWSGPIPAAEEEPDWMKLSVAGAEKVLFIWRHFVLHTGYLPRQARDKHRGDVEGRGFCRAHASGSCHLLVKETVFLVIFVYLVH